MMKKMKLQEITDKYMKCLEENRFDKHFLLFYNDGDTGQASSEKSEGASAQIVDMGNGFMQEKVEVRWKNDSNVSDDGRYNSTGRRDL